MNIKGQDILVILGLCVGPGERSYAEIARSLGLSASETHGAVARLTYARLLDPVDRSVVHRSLCNFLIHGVPFAFPVHTREVGPGIPTALAAPVLQGRFDAGLLPTVWPSREGTVQGVAVKPLYPSIPKIAPGLPALYDLLALVDVLRIGNAAERRVAGEEIFKRMTAFASV